MTQVVFAGAVLTGGASTRMGRDKALLEIEGRAMACRVADALGHAGATTVVCVGGDIPALRRLGLDAVPDRYPGEGPLGGAISALEATTEEIVVVAPCDLLGPDPADPWALVTALGWNPEVLAALPVEGDDLRPLPVALRRGALEPLAAGFAAGERSLHRALLDLAHRPVHGIDAERLADADTPDDLPTDLR